METLIVNAIVVEIHVLHPYEDFIFGYETPSIYFRRHFKHLNRYWTILVSFKLNQLEKGSSFVLSDDVEVSTI